MFETPAFNILDRIFGTEKKLSKAKADFAQKCEDWEVKRIETERMNAEAESAHRTAMEGWEAEKCLFLEQQQEGNRKVDELKEAYERVDPAAVIEYCELVLNNSEYPDAFPKNFELDYTPENRMLVVDYTLPSLDCFPRLNEVKYVAAKDELKEYYVSDAQFMKMFDFGMYAITLRTLHELFESDAAGVIEMVTFNGWIDSVNKATGKSEFSCILSVQAKKADFMEINLVQVDPKACFKSLR